ncbi:hypothetical protein V6U90_23455 [Micromonospora sp. CPCC 206060]|uniref:hypothetical protein n=1 Tax=Micromonospora sp. CPCC 206060 TaxID=3122406 RepID=UPI002FF3399F
MRNYGNHRAGKGVPLGLVHRRDWARWGRYCICGLRWRRCPDRGWQVPREEPQPTAPGWRPADPRWNARTATFWVGRAGLVTRGQAERCTRAQAERYTRRSRR